MIYRFLQSIIESTLTRSPAIAVLGPRQVGKTTLAKTIAKNRIQSLYLDVENPQDRQKLEDAYAYLHSLGDICIILDEVQLKPDLFSILRPLIDENRIAGRFILLGSASPSLVNGVSESLAGRIAYMELSGIGLTELSDKNDYKKSWFRGGFPNALLAGTDEACLDWLDDFIRSYIERDLGHLFGVDLSPVILRNFWSMLAHTNGNIWNAEVFARSLGVSAPTVLRYLSFLEGGYIARRLPPWFVNAKKRVIKSPKVYVRDTGIVHRLLNIPDYNSLLGHPGVGGSWEGYVIEQIYQRKPSGIELFYYRTQAGAECDLVLVKGITPLACIEIKLNNAPSISKGFFSCLEDLSPQYRYVITPESDTFTTSKGVVVTSLHRFVMELLAEIK
ncbi:MAG: ATP-binding protein [Chitinophagaceae bacterium]|nr:ATP-binding protein [Chitinophagaceae bacterium]